MISPLSTLEKKVLELENNISEIENESKDGNITPNCVCVNKNFSNLEVILTKRTLISRITLQDSSGIFFQGQVVINSPTMQEVTFTLQVNSTSIQKVTSNVVPGENSISFFCNFTPILTEKMPIYLKIEPKEQKPIYLQTMSLFVWGTCFVDEETKYQALELNDKYLLSLSNFQTLYYKLVDKTNYEFVIEDFDELAEANSYCFVYSKGDDLVYLLRVSSDNELFFRKLGEQESFIMQNVTDVSACYKNGQIFAFVIIDEEMYSIEFDVNGHYSNPVRVNIINTKCKKLYAYIQNEADKIYLDITDINGNNFLLEQIDESKCCTENLNATYKIEFYVSGSKI